MKEIWMDIPNYKGYQVSNFGKVRTYNKITYSKKHGERHWKNRIYDADKVIFNTTLTIVWLNVILASVNIFINSEVIRGFILGIDFLALWQSLIKMVVSNHNLKCKTKALKEKIELTKRIADNDRRHL